MRNLSSSFLALTLVLTHGLAFSQAPPALGPTGTPPPPWPPGAPPNPPGPVTPPAGSPASTPPPGPGAPTAGPATSTAPAAGTSTPTAPASPGAAGTATVDNGAAGTGTSTSAVGTASATTSPTPVPAEVAAGAPTPLASPPTDTPAGDDGKGDKHEPSLDLLLRVHTRYIYSDLDPTHFFELRRARLGFEFEPTEGISAELDLDAADAPAVKDAFVTLKAHRALRFTVGQFKKPFSRIALTSAGRLPLWNRGITNGALVRGQNFGGRDIGVSVGGRVKRLRYELGVFNGNGTAGEIDSGKDVAMRVEVKPVKPLSVGLSGSMKHRNVPDVDYPRNTLWAGGVDLGLEIGNFESVIEAIGAQGTATEAGPWQLGTLGYVLYRIPLTKQLELRPLVKLEFLDDDVSSSGDHAVALMGGANLHIGDPVRILLQAEQITAEADSAVSEERRLILQLAFDMNYGVKLSAAPAEKK